MITVVEKAVMEVDLARCIFWLLSHFFFLQTALLHDSYELMVARFLFLSDSLFGRILFPRIDLFASGLHGMMRVAEYSSRISTGILFPFSPLQGLDIGISNTLLRLVA